MTRVHHYSIVQSSFTALKILCAPQSLATTDLFTVFIVLPFPDVTELESYSMKPFQIGFFHLVICT